MTIHGLTLPLSLAALALAACGGGSKTSDGGGDPPDTRTCHSCHGSTESPAPPVSTTGATATTDVGVGAHQIHLAGGALGVKVACTECHAVPTSNDHASGTAEVTFGAFAKTGGRTPTWDHASATCSSVYCHGAGGAASTPLWTRVDGTQATCGSCHGDPPTENGHPQVTSAYCSGCHPATMNANGTLNVAGGKHLDGTVQAVAFSHPSSWLGGHQSAATADHGVSCKACHGSDFKGGTSGQSCYMCHPAGPPV